MTRDYTLKTYTIFGNTLEEVQKNFKFIEDGEKYASETRSKISYTYEESRGKIKKVDFSVETEVEYPIWPAVDRQSRPVQNEWRRFIAATFIHEKGHVLIGLRIKQTKNRYIGLGIERAVQQINSAIENVHKENERYDFETRHGKEQGAELNVKIK